MFDSDSPILRTVRLVAILLCALTSASSAQEAFSVTVERPVRVVDVGAFTTFELRVHSRSSEELGVRLARVVNGLPDTSWHSSICSMSICYDEEISLTGTESLPAGGMTGFTLHVYAGSRYGDTARVLLRVETEDGGDTALRELVVVTAPPAQRLFRVEPERLAQSVVVGDTAEFVVWAFNEAGDTLGIGVERIDEFAPDSSWSSLLCVEETCYPGSIDAPPSLVLENDRATWFRLRVVAGSPGQGRFILRFSTTRRAEPIEHRFTVDAGAAGIMPERSAARVVAVAPVPATDAISITGAGSGVDSRITVYDASGRVVMNAVIEGDARGALRLDVGRLPGGVYRFTLEGGEGGIGEFVIARAQ